MKFLESPELLIGAEAGFELVAFEVDLATGHVLRGATPRS